MSSHAQLVGRGWRPAVVLQSEDLFDEHVAAARVRRGGTLVVYDVDTVQVKAGDHVVRSGMGIEVLKPGAFAKRFGFLRHRDGVCRVCGCSQHDPCPTDGCYWVDPDLCSSHMGESS